MTGSTYDRLRELILGNAFDAGEQLTETVLADKLGVSRTPVREALNRLEQDGLVERSGRGVRIRERSPEEILEIYEVRVALEAAAARAAAVRRTELDLSRLTAIHEEMIALPEGDLEARIAWNSRFHQALWRASHNETLEDVIERLLSHYTRYPQTTLSFPGRWELILGEHEKLLDAIRDRDADRASAISAEHMTTARDTRLQMYARELTEHSV